MGELVTFSAGGREVSGYLATPAQGSGPGVLVLHAWWGLTDFFKSACDRLAGEGFVALAPDLYHGATAPGIEEAEQLSSTLDYEAAFQDVAGAIEFLRNHPAVAGPAMGAIGFSLGSAFALPLQEPFRAIVTFYGLTYPDRVNGDAAYLGHFAENDEYESADVMRQLETRLQGLGRDVHFYVYPGTQHWFVEEDRPGYYDPDAAALAWERTVSFLRQNLDLA